MLRLLVVRLRSDAVLPSYGRSGDAGLDLFACEEHDLRSGERHAFRTGIAVAIPAGYVGLVWDRSGLAVHAGITTMAGVIDATYRGEVAVPLLNTGTQSYRVHRGDRIAQLLVQAIPPVEVAEVDALDETARGSAGFGSSGR
jgi:dUTP pyrophosphatase